VDLVEQGLEPFVFGGPSAHTSEQVSSDADGTSLALDLAGEVPGQIRLAVVDAAA
jgi:hypothetical protein